MAEGPRLVPPRIDRGLAEMIAFLAEGVRRGEINGLVFGASLRGGRRYFVDVAGVLANHTTLARGIVAALDDELSRMEQDQAQENTTLPGEW